MLHWNEYSAWVTTDGEDAVEYEVQTSEDDRTVTCWIASERFSISWKNSSSTSAIDVMGYLTVDGIYCGGSVLWFGTAVPETKREDGIYDDDDDAFLDSSHEKLGLIELRIGPVEEIDEDRTYSRWRCGVRKTQKSPILKPKVPDLTVHERVKKGVTQQITLGEPESLDKDDEDGFNHVYTEPSGPDIVKFCFKYRSIGARPRLDLLQPTNRLMDVVLRAEVLRADGIAPRLKRKKASTDRNRAQISNAPAEDQPAQNSNALAEEAKVLREKLRAVEAQLQEQEQKPRVKVKNEPAGAVIDLTQDSARQRKRVKLEGNPFVSGEVIDLT
ncbi:hypothetical protein B0H13DRAFT_2491400 [Mycena leptocephala]|nr:hypothetical protein B0H13DRAFT_2491400 [Mycena leptocephala]